MGITVNWHATEGTSACAIQSGEARWSADVEPSLGGAGTSPTPHELLDSALGACTVLTIQLYARRRAYPLDGVQVVVEREETGGVYRLNKRIELSGELDSAARQDLLRVASKCPIHKALLGQFEIHSELV